jgi:mobilome CxxCx(11)CxxC protein
LFLSICSIVYRWSDVYQLYLESFADNNSLASEYEQLVKFTDKDFDTLKIEKDKLDIRKDNRTKQDSKNSLSEKECRRGMRWSLRNYQRSCAGCGKIPTDMENTSCGVCGNFKLFNKKQ